jgi:hypothetical protein
MTHGHRLLAPVLLFDLSLTSSRHLGRLFSHSEAPFWTARNRSRFRLLRSDYPLYFMSFGSLRLSLRKHAAEDRFYLRMLDVYEAAMHSDGPHSRKIGARSELEHVSIRGTVGPSFGRNQQPSGSHVGTQFLRCLKQFFGVGFVGFRVDVRGVVCDCQLLPVGSIPNIWSLLYFAPTLVRVCDRKPRITRNLRELLARAWTSSQDKRNRNTPELLSKRSTSMHHSRGHLRFEPLFTTEELGLPEHANIAHVVKVFLAIGDGVAARWIEMPKSVLLLQTVAGIAESGAIYLYDRERHQFYLAVFEQGHDDTLTTTEFEQLVAEYDLLGYIENRRNVTALSLAGNA